MLTTKQVDEALDDAARDVCLEARRDLRGQQMRHRARFWRRLAEFALHELACSLGDQAPPLEVHPRRP